MKPAEIIRIIILTLLGAALMFIIQPWIYQTYLIVPDTEFWVRTYYYPAALGVFVVPVLSTVIWCVMTAITRDSRGHEVSRWALVWWGIGLLPVLSIGWGVHQAVSELAEVGGQVILLLTSFFVLDVLVLFWLTTTTSTPYPLMYIPPGSFFLRGLLGDRGD